MTSIMLASYPDVFAGGAIIAGLPYGAALNVQQAFKSMYQSPSRPPREGGETSFVTLQLTEDAGRACRFGMATRTRL